MKMFNFQFFFPLSSPSRTHKQQAEVFFTMTMMSARALLTTLLLSAASAWQAPQAVNHQVSDNARRSLLVNTPIFAISSFATVANAATDTSNLKFTTSSSGLQYADVKEGSSSTPSPTDGQIVSIDYVMSTTGARYGSKIYSTVDAGAPYRWELGDGSTIPGLEEAVKGMSPGGIRRVIIPSKLAYQSASATPISIIQECENGKGLGPIPPVETAVGEFQRFKNIYCNPDRQYQPDLVMDVKLYGKRN